MQQDWENQLLAQEHACQQIDATNATVFCSLRVCIGLHWGIASCAIDCQTKRQCYLGEGPMGATAIAVLAQPGQILVLHAAIHAFVSDMLLDGILLATPKGCSQLGRCFEIVSQRLEPRYFGACHKLSLESAKVLCQTQQDNSEDYSSGVALCTFMQTTSSIATSNHPTYW